MFETIFWGGVLRVTQAFMQAAPTILVGLAVAAIFRRLLGHEGTRRLFGCGTWRELPQAWFIGMLLPICSLGVIPVAREMRRARISGRRDPGFRHDRPAVQPAVDALWPDPLRAIRHPGVRVLHDDRGDGRRRRSGTGSCRPPAHEEPAPPPVAYGVKRMAAIVVAAARETAGPSLAYIALALLGVALLCAVLPHGSLQTTMEHSNPYAPLAMAAVAIPAYATPMVAMSQLGSMFQHANSVGAAFVLLTLGAGINLGLIAWVWRNYGLARGLAWLAILLAVVLGLAYAVENPLHPSEIQPPGHTHAFDIYCRPFEPGRAHLPATVLAKLKEDLHPFERVGLTVLASLAVVGLALRTLDRRWHVEDWLERTPEPGERASSRLDVAVPAPSAGRDRPRRAGGPQRGGLFRLLPRAPGGLRGNVHPEGRGADRGPERQPEARGALHPDLGRLDPPAPGRRLPPRGVAQPSIQ